MKALALLSGGLDSTLAVKLIAEQGIEVIALNFHGPFCTCSHTGCRYVSKDLGCEFKTVALGQDYLEMVKHPKHGYGSFLNPCIDCRIFIFRKAKELMKDLGASFVISGEILGQRPMSQHKRALNIIEKESALEGLIVRPLCAKLLEPTIPEQSGWVNREKLLSFSGRSRKPQLLLAKESGIKEIFCAGGGCLLNDAIFSRKVKDLIKHNCFTLEESHLLRIGRHFRLNENLKLIVGRDERENNALQKYAEKKYAYLFPEELKGPLGLLDGNFENDGFLDKACSIIAYYSDKNLEDEVVKIRLSGNHSKVNRILEAKGLGSEILDGLRV